MWFVHFLNLRQYMILRFCLYHSTNRLYHLIFYVVAAIWAEFARCFAMLRMSLPKLYAMILVVKNIFDLIKPNTGISSTRNLRLNTDGIPSIAFLMRESVRYSSVDNFSAYAARATILDEICTAYVFRCGLPLHSSRCGQFSQWHRLNWARQMSVFG